jgi:hypothetical protein
MLESIVNGFASVKNFVVENKATIAAGVGIAVAVVYREQIREVATSLICNVPVTPTE